MITRESSEFNTKQETSTTSDHGTAKKPNKPSSSTTSITSAATTSSWSRLKDPRIVRVSRAFGGKDRHSKVCTVRGLRDRRVRLSVPTAIQLYDLQDRLGLNQPSKVVDWLLNAAKHEIDELPPLQIPQGFNFSQNFLTSNEFRATSSQSAAKQGLKIGDDINWNINDPLKVEQGRSSSDIWGKSKDFFESDQREDNSWARSSNDEDHQRQFNNQLQDNNQGASFFSPANNFFFRQSNHPSSIPNVLNTSSSIPYNSFLRWDPSSLTLSHPPRSHGLMDEPDNQDSHNFSLVPLPSSLNSVPSGSHQVLVYHQPGTTTQSYFRSEIDSDFTQKQLHFQNLSNSLMTANLLPSQNNADNEQDKDNDHQFHLQG